MKDHKLELDASRNDVILVIGRSGVGKSTMTEILFGDLPALESTFDPELLCIKIRNTKKAPASQETSMLQSDTICPQLFTDPTKPELSIYDCPGFVDTRGTSNEIATGVYLSQIVENADRVKLVATVDYDSVKPNADRSKFTDAILPEILDFVLNSDIFQGGVFLLVTKFSNPNEDPNEKFKDEDIVGAIANFLKEAQRQAVKSANDKKRESAIDALFEKSWLKRVDGKYPNIAYTRTISGKTSHKLSDLEALTRRDLIRSQILDNPAFVFKASNRTYFGCPISDAAKLEIRRVQKNLAAQTQAQLRSVGQKVINKYVDSSKDHKQLASFVNEYLAFLNDIKALPPAESGLTTKSLDLLRKFGRNINGGTELEMKNLADLLKRISYLSSVDLEDFAAVWKEAHESLDQAKENMGKDLLMQFRKTCSALATEANQLLTLLGQRVVIKFSKVKDNSFLDHFKAFSNNITSLMSVEPGLSYKGLEMLREFGRSIGTNMDYEVDKLAGIISCFNYLTEVDIEQSGATWSDIHMKWDHVITFMDKEIEERVAQRELEQANAQAAIDLAVADAKVAAARNEAELVQAKAQRAWAESESTRIATEAENKLLKAQMDNEAAKLKSQEEVREALRRVEEAERLNRENKKKIEELSKSNCRVM